MWLASNSARTTKLPRQAKVMRVRWVQQLADDSAGRLLPEDILKRNAPVPHRNQLDATEGEVIAVAAAAVCEIGHHDLVVAECTDDDIVEAEAFEEGIVFGDALHKAFEPPPNPPMRRIDAEGEVPLCVFGDRSREARWVLAEVRTGEASHDVLGRCIVHLRNPCSVQEDAAGLFPEPHPGIRDA